MARVSLILSALTAGAILAASPLASATNSGQTLPQVPVQTVNNPLPAQSADLTAMSMCGQRDQVLQELAQQFREKPMAVGQVDGNAVVEILVSESGTWTILATGTDGQSCIVSAGEGFESTTLVRGIDA